MKGHALQWLLSIGLVCGASIQAFGQAKDQKEKKEIGSDKNTGGPTQKDRDTVNDIKDKFKEQKEKQQQEKKEREKKQGSGGS